MARYRSLRPGDPAPWFKARCTTNDTFAFDTVGGRYLVLCFFMTASDAKSQEALAAASAASDLFDDVHAAFFGVSVDPADETEQRVSGRVPGVRIFWDFDGTVSRLYGAAPDGNSPAGATLRRFWLVLDPSLRIMRVILFTAVGSNAEAVLSYVRSLPPPGRHAGFDVQAPILVLPDVLEPELCDTLIGLHKATGGRDTGFMAEVDGITVERHNPGHKRRRDYIIEDQALIARLHQRLQRRVVPDLLKAYQYKATRIERHLVGCYRAEDGGHFSQHRDNTTKGTAHRRFAVSINLNAEFDGGEISFPEYGPRSFKPPPGAAVVFSCSLLHAVSKVTRGQRFAFLPFLYDEEAAKTREANLQFVGAASAASAG